MKVNKTGETFSKDSTKKSKRLRRRISRTGHEERRLAVLAWSPKTYDLWGDSSQGCPFQPNLALRLYERGSGLEET